MSLTEPDITDRERIEGLRPRQALYWMAECPTHGRTTFGTYYRTRDQVETGCLNCWWDEGCPACPPAGTPYQADLRPSAAINRRGNHAC